MSNVKILEETSKNRLESKLQNWINEHPGYMFQFYYTMSEQRYSVLIWYRRAGE